MINYSYNKEPEYRKILHLKKVLKIFLRVDYHDCFNHHDLWWHSMNKIESNYCLILNLVSNQSSVVNDRTRDVCTDILTGRCLQCRPLWCLQVIVAQKLVSNGLNGTTGIYSYCGLFRVVSMFNSDGGVGVEKGCFYSSEISIACQCALSIVTFIQQYTNPYTHINRC